MNTLDKPSRDMADKILKEVDFDSRLTGFRLNTGKGFMKVDMYSFEEVVGLLHVKYPYIEIDKLESWVRNTMEDAELADRIKELAENNGSELDKLLAAGRLMGQRLMQCKKFL